MEWFLEHDLLIRPSLGVRAGGERYNAARRTKIHSFKKHVPDAASKNQKGISNKFRLNICDVPRSERRVALSIYRVKIKRSGAAVDAYRPDLGEFLRERGV